MRFGRDIVTPSYTRGPTFNSLNGIDRAYAFDCLECLHRIAVGFAAVGQFRLPDAFGEATEKQITEHFKLNIVGKSPDGGWPEFKICRCDYCSKAYMIYVGVHEVANSAYVITVQGVSELWMSTIPESLAKSLPGGRKGFIPFVTAGDPNLETSLAICLKLAELSADVIELGVPFSDPMADGPTIQRSSQRALENEVTLEDVLDLAKSFRAASDVPIVLFSYFNPIMSMGLDEFARAASEAGIDGLLLTDVIDMEAAKISQKLGEYNIDLISLVAPTTTDERLKEICRHARGFVYAVSRAGVTGARESVSDTAEKLVTRTRNFTDLPIAVGFGISTAEQIASVWRYADAAVVGSAIVAEIEKAGPANAVEQVETFCRQLLPQFAKTGAET